MTGEGGEAIEWLMAPPPPPPRRSHRSRVVVIFVVGALAGVGAFFVRHEDVKTYPDEWDPRVRDLVAFVQAQRNLEFEHPVPIQFLDESDWERRMVVSSDELTDADREALEGYEEVSRALGFVEGDIDLGAIDEEMATDGVAAFYEFASEGIYVNGAASGRLSVTTRGTLVHELTHALQDQHFDLDQLYERAGDDWGGLLMLVEGDATNVEDAWVAGELSEAEFDEYWDEVDAAQDAYGDDVEIPSILALSAGAPYVLGPTFVRALLASGDGRLDEAYAEIPTGEHAFNPASFLAGDTTERVTHPRLPEDTREIESGEFGALMWYLLLSERIDPHDALDAVQGWGGDAYVAYTEAGKTCVDVVYRGETNRDTIQMGQAVNAWIYLLPKDSARSGLDPAGDLTLHSCDPGVDADLTTGQSVRALALPLVYNEVLALALDDGKNVDNASCIAAAVVRATTLDEFSKTPTDEALRRRLREAAASC